MSRRTDRSVLADWWWTVDRTLVIAFVFLIVGGLVISFGASTPVAEHHKLDTFHFVKRHALFIVPAIPILVATAFLKPRAVRRLAGLVLLVGIALLLATLFVGHEVKGARRWINIAGFSLQPSEFVKPAFIIVAAWLFSENTRRPDIPGSLFAIMLLGVVVALLIAQPDFGQTMLVVLAWGAVFFVAGMSWLWIIGLGGVGAAGILTAYLTIPHVAGRINRFLDPSGGGTYQVDRAVESFIAGGWIGQGPGEGTVKRVLPDSHADFVFAVVGEEFGILACMALALLFGFIVLRGLAHAAQEEDAFVRLGVVGLVVLIGTQAAINMAVNLHLVPAKGMTLPFISYGGSSLLSLAYAMGCLLALTRRRPQRTRLAPALPARGSLQPAAAGA